jgi:hypothetical protein
MPPLLSEMLTMVNTTPPANERQLRPQASAVSRPLLSAPRVAEERNVRDYAQDMSSFQMPRKRSGMAQDRQRPQKVGISNLNSRR